MCFSFRFLFQLISHELLDALALGTGIVIAVALHEVDHTPHSQTGTEGNNERLKDRNRLIDKFHRVTSLIFECELLKMGKKIEAPSLFCFGHCPCAVHDGASIGFNLSHVIEVEGLGGLDYADLSRRLDEAVQRRSKFDEAMSVDNKWITLMKSVSTATQLSQDLVDESVELVKVHEGGAVELVMKYGDIYELTIQSIKEVQEAM